MLPVTNATSGSPWRVTSSGGYAAKSVDSGGMHEVEHRARIHDCPSIDTLSLELNDRQLAVDIFNFVFLEEVFQIEVVEVLVSKFINSYSWGPFH